VPLLDEHTVARDGRVDEVLQELVADCCSSRSSAERIPKRSAAVSSPSSVGSRIWISARPRIACAYVSATSSITRSSHSA
jgi:hypothetical protein